MKVMGGLASQMHKYAMGRLIADQHNVELLLDISWFEDNTDVDTKREFELDKFKARFSIASESDVCKLKSGFLRRRMSSISKRVGLNHNFLSKSHYVDGVTVGNVFAVEPPIYIEGEWFGAKYLDSNRERLVKDLSLSSPLDGDILMLLQEIISSESVAIHVRRGDFVSNPLASSFHYLTDLNYYKLAIQECISLLGDPRFFVFSDDPDWVERNFSVLEGDFTFVQPNQSYEDLELIKKCRHQIICNSGFGWFGAWLNQTENKINIAPKLWVKDLSLNNAITSDLINSGMVLI